VAPAVADGTGGSLDAAIVECKSEAERLTALQAEQFLAMGEPAGTDVDG